MMVDGVVAKMLCPMCGHEADFVLSKTATIESLEKMNNCLDRARVKEAINNFEEVMTDSLGLNKPEDCYERGKLGIKFDILRNTLGLE